MFSSATPSTPTRLADGRRAAIGGTYFGARWLDVEVQPGRWVGIAARNLDDATLLELGLQLRVGADDRAALDGALPAGLTFHGPASESASVPYTAPVESLGAWPVPMSSTGYGPAGSSVEVTVSLLDRNPSTRALVGLIGSVTPATSATGTAHGVALEGAEAMSFYVERGDVAVWAMTVASPPTAGPEQVLALIDSLEPVAESTWDELSGRGGFGQSPDVVEDVGATNTPPQGVPVYEQDGSRSVVELDYTVAQSDVGVSATAALPTGESISFAADFAGREMVASAMVDGAEVSRFGLGLDVADGAAATQSELPRGGLVHAYVTRDERAAELRIAVGGVEYRAPLLRLDAYPEVALAVVIVPPDAEGATEADDAHVGPSGSIVTGVFSAEGELLTSM